MQKIVDSETGIFISNEITSLDISKAQQSSQFALIRKEQGELYLQAAISKIIKEALRFLPSKMNEQDIIYFSKFFSKELWHWKFDDFILCFKKGINKEYGDIYGEFNISVFMKWADLYEKEKKDFFLNKHLSSTEKNDVTEDNKHNIHKERNGKTNNTASLKDYISSNIIPDENYFKK